MPVRALHGRGRIGDMGRHVEIAPVVDHPVAVDHARHAGLARGRKKPRRAGDPGDIGEDGVRALGQARWQPGGVVGRAHIGVASDETLPFRVDEHRRGRRPQAGKTPCEAAIDAGRLELRDDRIARSRSSPRRVASMALSAEPWRSRERRSPPSRRRRPRDHARGIFRHGAACLRRHRRNRASRCRRREPWSSRSRTLADHEPLLNSP